jgi:hypothetical protein
VYLSIVWCQRAAVLPVKVMKSTQTGRNDDTAGIEPPGANNDKYLFGLAEVNIRPWKSGFHWLAAFMVPGYIQLHYIIVPKEKLSSIIMLINMCTIHVFRVWIIHLLDIFWSRYFNSELVHSCIYRYGLYLYNPQVYNPMYQQHID